MKTLTMYRESTAKRISSKQTVATYLDYSCVWNKLQRG